MAANSQRNPNACRCGLVATCKTCRNREYKFKFVQNNREHIRKYWMDYYYDRYVEMRARQNICKRQRVARRKAQQEIQK